MSNWTMQVWLCFSHCFMLENKAFHLVYMDKAMRYQWLYKIITDPTNVATEYLVDVGMNGNKDGHRVEHLDCQEVCYCQRWGQIPMVVQPLASQPLCEGMKSSHHLPVCCVRIKGYVIRWFGAKYKNGCWHWVVTCVQRRAPGTVPETDHISVH